MAARKPVKRAATRGKKKTTRKTAPKHAAKKFAAKKKPQKKISAKKARKRVMKRKPGEILFALSLRASPSAVYQTLMSPELYSKSEPAHISHVEGGKIREFDGHVRGRNLELVPDEKIVQLWRQEDWPPGLFSTATFTLKKTRIGTKLELKQSGVPAFAEDSVKREWEELYWKPLKAIVEGQA